MRYHGAKGNLSSDSATMELDERFDVLIDANDQLLERVVKQASFIQKDNFMFSQCSLSILLMGCTMYVSAKCAFIMHISIS